MASSPSAAFLRLRAFFAERMRMSPINQPRMLLELLGRRSPAPAHDVARRILPSAWWAGFTFNGITAYGDGRDSLIGGDELSDGERDALLDLCRQRLDAFREQRGDEVFAHRSRHRSPISGSVKYRVHRCAQGRCECCGADEHQRALEVDHIDPKKQGCSGPISNLQALCFRGLQASDGHHEAGCVFCALEGSGRVLLENELALFIADADLVIEGQAMSFQSCAPRAMGSCQVQR
jgi:ATP adenylyltransferase